MDRLHEITMEFSIDEVLEAIHCAVRVVPSMESIVINDFLSILNQSENQATQQRDFRISPIPYCGTPGYTGT